MSAKTGAEEVVGALARPDEAGKGMEARLWSQQAAWDEDGGADGAQGTQARDYG